MDQIHEEYKLAFLKLKQAYVNRLKNTIRIIDNIFENRIFWIVIKE